MSRRLGCGLLLGLVALSPGGALVAAGLWVRAQGGGTAVLLSGLAALGLGGFVLLAIGAILRRSSPVPAALRPPEV